MSERASVGEGVHFKRFDVDIPGIGGYGGVLKRLLDIFVSILISPLALPIVAILFLVARLDGGPGFFGHSRVGRDGYAFRCWKIRTMLPDAEQRLQALLDTDPAARAQWEREQKLADDPRITAFGSFLRKTSLDELPQIWNVLKGEMSIVGPRPVTEAELERYGAQARVYLNMRPGITGLWQVSGRKSGSYAERVQFDVTYYQQHSFYGDVGIILKTFGAVLARTGR